jgi:hypothetical protein
MVSGIRMHFYIHQVTWATCHGYIPYFIYIMSVMWELQTCPPHAARFTSHVVHRMSQAHTPHHTRTHHTPHHPPPTTHHPPPTTHTPHTLRISITGNLPGGVLCVGSGGGNWVVVLVVVLVVVMAEVAVCSPSIANTPGRCPVSGRQPPSGVRPSLPQDNGTTAGVATRLPNQQSPTAKGQPFNPLGPRPTNLHFSQSCRAPSPQSAICRPPALAYHSITLAYGCKLHASPSSIFVVLVLNCKLQEVFHECGYIPNRQTMACVW